MLLSLAISGVVAMQAPSARAVVTSAERAVASDSGAVASARWSARLAKAPTDRPARLGRATVERLTFEYERADGDYASLLAPGTPVDAYAVYAHIGVATSQAARGLLSPSERTYEEAIAAARTAGDRAGHATALIELAVMRARTKSPAAALLLLDSAQRLITAGDVPLLAKLRCNRATAMAVSLAPATRVEALAGARLARQAGDARLEGRCLHVLAQDLWREGRTDSAIAVLATAKRAFAGSHHGQGLAVTLQWRGSLLVERGDYAAARAELRAAVEAGTRAGAQSAIGWASMDLATIAAALGDFPAARSYLAQAVRSHEGGGDVWAMANALLLRGALDAEAGEVDSARVRFSRAASIADKSTVAVARVEALRALARLALRGRDFALATMYLDSARRAAERQKLERFEAALLGDDAALLLAQAKPDSAEPVVRRAMALTSPTDHMQRFRFSTMLADADARRGLLDRAQQEIGDASAALDAWRSSLTEREMRQLVFQWRERPSLPDDGVARVIAALATGGRVAAAFAVADGRRAREMRDAIARATALGNASAAPLRREAPAIDLDSLRRVLPAGTALVEFAAGRGGQPTTLFAITRGWARAVALASMDSLAPDVSRFSALVESGGEAKPFGARLGERLLSDALESLPADVTRLVLVPDDVLHRLPFDALVMRDGRYLIERFAVSLVPSASVASRLWLRPPTSAVARVLAFGDPEFVAGRGEPPRAPPTTASTDTIAFASVAGLPRLPASDREARVAGAFAPRSVVRLRAAASEWFLKHAPMRDFTIIHFATHAFVDRWDASRSALALAPGGGEDGLVTAAELGALRLSADLVVLSACRTGGGPIVGGEGVQGLAAPLLESGTRAVVVTSWSVADRAALRVVEMMYRGMAQQRPLTDALRDAKLALLRADAPPREWAVFTLIGDPSVRARLRP